MLGTTFAVMTTGALPAPPAGRGGWSVVPLMSGPSATMAALFTKPGVAVARYAGAPIPVTTFPSNSGKHSAREPLIAPVESDSTTPPALPLSNWNASTFAPLTRYCCAFGGTNTV